MTFIATLSSKNQITIPVAAVRELGMKPKTKLMLKIVDGQLQARPIKKSVVDEIINNFHLIIPSHLKGKSWEEIKEEAGKEYTKYLVKKYNLPKKIKLR